jgi:hypothetical protein
VCCTETAPAWLAVSLGAVRPVASFQLYYKQDMTFTLSVANSSAGPFTTVAQRTCDTCIMNADTDNQDHASWIERLRSLTVMLPRPVEAAFVKMTIVWSSAGGIGGCSDLCDWATDVHDFLVYSPGALPALPQAMPPPVPKEAAAAATCPARTTTFLSQDDGGAGCILTGDALRRAKGSGAGGAGSVALAGPEPLRFGAAEFTRVLRPAVDCGCADTHIGVLTVYVWMGGGQSWPGEGLVISLVDATRQTPGATRYMAGCGTRPLLPAYAVSVVFDTAISDPSCDEPGPGARVVSTLNGPDEPPVVLAATLETSTALYRAARWVPVQFDFVVRARSGRGPGVLAPFAVTLDWQDFLNPFIMLETHLRGANATLEAMYLVVSARTGASASDQHAFSGLHVDCVTLTDLTAFPNLAIYRQPLTPPPLALQPPYAAPPAAQQPQRSLGAQVPAAAAGAASFAAAFCGALGALCLAAFVLHKRALADVAAPEPQKGDGLLPAQPPQPPQPPRPPRFHVFLSYRRADWRLVDALQDKLLLCGVRAFKDVDGRMAGRPFDTELLAAVASAAVFAPVITVPSLQRMAGAAASNEPDTSLAECLAALYFRHHHAPQPAVRLIHPVLVGPEVPVDMREGGVQWLSLVQDAAYADALAELPDVVPAATVALVDSALRRSQGAPLPHTFACLTVRQIMLGRQGAQPGQLPLPAVPGILSGQPFELACTHSDVGLYIRLRYMPAIQQHAGPLDDADVC